MVLNQIDLSSDDSIFMKAKLESMSTLRKKLRGWSSVVIKEENMMMMEMIMTNKHLSFSWMSTRIIMFN